ncbi:MAG: hypothetical protein LUG98_13490 [Tannerellaceae bacterium]|nr:hypothetical protein [Tannerellaceae bacterium]
MTHTIFEFCCDIIDAIAQGAGWTYKEANVYIFVWLQPVLVLLSALAMTIATMWYNKTRRTPLSTVLNITAVSLLIFYTILFLQACFRYSIPIDDAYRLAQEDMIRFGKPIHANYEEMNFILFVFGMPGIILINSILTYKIYKLKI